MTELLEIHHFQPHLGKKVIFKGTRYVMPVHEVVQMADTPYRGAKRIPFSVIFRAPKEREWLAEGMYECEVEDGPTFQLYVVPIQTPEPEWQDYQAAFN